jgi:hypothetical protein
LLLEVDGAGDTSHIYNIYAIFLKDVYSIIEKEERERGSVEAAALECERFWRRPLVCSVDAGACILIRHICHT